MDYRSFEVVFPVGELASGAVFANSHCLEVFAEYSFIVHAH
jgi:hypothetical protein